MAKLSEKTSEMEAFVAVAQEGGFTKASIELDISPSAVSKRISRLEDRLGTKLLNRSTRRSALTEAGVIFLQRCQDILSEISGAEEEAKKFSSEPIGTLRVNCSILFADIHIIPLLNQFYLRYPNVHIDLNTALDINLFEENIDVGFHYSKPPDSSSLIVRKLSSNPWTICASPEYLSRRGQPQTPEDLLNHNCCIDNSRPQYNRWEFEDQEGYRIIKVSGNFEAVGALVHKAALLGVGICQLPRYSIFSDIENGRLVPLLEDKRPQNKRIIYLFYPHRKNISLKVRVFIDFLLEHLPQQIEGGI